MASRVDLDVALRRLVVDRGVPLKKLAEKLDMSAEECLEWWSLPKKRIPFSKVKNLTSILGVSVEDLVRNKISDETIDVGLLNLENKISSRYAENAFSFTISSKHIIEFIALRYGNVVANSILHRLGVSRGFFNSVKNRISIRFYEDILREYVRLGNRLEDIQQLSKAIFLTTEEDPEGRRLFPKCNSYAEGFQKVFESTRSFDENFDYKFEIYSDKVRIHTQPSEKLVEAFRDNDYGSKELYMYRSQLFGNMVSLCGLPAVKMKVLKCVTQGDARSVYEAEYPNCYFLSRDL